MNDIHSVLQWEIPQTSHASLWYVVTSCQWRRVSPNVVTSCQRRRRVSPNVVTSCQRWRRVSPNIHSSRTQGTPQSLNTLPIITPAFLCVPHTYVQECRPHIHAVHTAHTNEWCTSADRLTSPPPISIK